MVGNETMIAIFLIQLEEFPWHGILILFIQQQQICNLIPYLSAINRSLHLDKFEN